eukprot:CAMPEP_0178831138 /NCGR_PEP_ID=MMETSP0746-20121128/9296_1 /TAXON_ID=913974 /ORGANISM="Nitzschia punctata, Strain CCMP561" /LENGTH=147 /DNA_ID=CAMNT_0020493351 /DNA_START=315 /DNA_END=758 /DNA_ORIENTATION=-
MAHGQAWHDLHGFITSPMQRGGLMWTNEITRFIMAKESSIPFHNPEHPRLAPLLDLLAFADGDTREDFIPLGFLGSVQTTAVWFFFVAARAAHANNPLSPGYVYRHDDIVLGVDERELEAVLKQYVRHDEFAELLKETAGYARGETL